MSVPDRASVWRLLGEPSEQVGSANDPRRQVEHGYAWNEKWIYRDRRGAIERVVLWNRLDPVGVFRVDPDQGWIAEALPAGAEGDAGEAAARAER